MKHQPHTKLILIATLLALLPNLAVALEYRSVAVPKAILYDAPSLQGKKLYLIGQGYPVEVIVNLGDWLKVRDNQGGISWIETKQLSAAKRTVLINQAQTELHQSADASSTLIAKFDKDVILDLLEPSKNGWVKVKHKDGLTGYILTSVAWGS